MLNPWFRQASAETLTRDTAAAVTQISDAAERERLIGDLAADGITLPAPPAPAVLPGTGPDRHSTRHDLARTYPIDRPASTDGDEATEGPGAATRTSTPAVPQFRGPARRP
jgi:hypothetical protein